nr:MAG TPA_asm: hypothetical protein [Caudoviricetes sp.]
MERGGRALPVLHGREARQEERGVRGVRREDESERGVHKPQGEEFIHARSPARRAWCARGSARR